MDAVVLASLLGNAARRTATYALGVRLLCRAATGRSQRRPTPEVGRGPEWATGIADFHRLAERKVCRGSAIALLKVSTIAQSAPTRHMTAHCRTTLRLRTSTGIFTSTLSVLHFLRQRLKHGIIFALTTTSAFRPPGFRGSGGHSWNFRPRCPIPISWSTGGMARTAWYVVEARDGNPSLPTCSLVQEIGAFYDAAVDSYPGDIAAQ